MSITRQTPAPMALDVERTPDGDVVTMTGQLDEHVSLTALVDRLGDRVTIDLDGVRFINSVGVREWILFLAALAARGADVRLRSCSEPMVRQMNMVVEASGAAAVESFHAPFACDECSNELSLVIPVAPHRDELRAHKVPPQRCPSCGGALLFDDFPNRYLLFLESEHESERT